MNQARQDQLFRMFEEARQLEADQRTEFIVRSCGADDALRAEVVSLLEADTASGEFMVQPALDRLAQAMAGERWTLHAGETIGPYTIVQLLGSGGAGEVWRARDERLRRDVAIKVLLPHVAADADRLYQFAEEARMAGALNHSNILTVYDVGEHQGIPYLVSECLEGRNLRQRLDDAPTSVEEARAIALGVASGLAAAHARSIVHRDLKPGNTFLQLDGSLKILDFGLAKLQFSSVPTETHRTLPGVILGTAGYMAPEQVKGEHVDARADLFALGVMLYEMLVGQHPFRGASTFETLYAVLTIAPPDPVSLNARVPPALGRIAMRLLAKDPVARFQSAADVVWALEQVETPAAGHPGVLAPAGESRRWWRSSSVVWSAALAVTALALLTAWLTRVPSREGHASALTRFTWPLPAGIGLGSAPVVSPNGRHIAFVGHGATGNQLYVRGLGAVDAVAIPGTEDAAHPFWSPDSTSLGFFAKGKLMKVALKGGAPAALAEALFPFGGTWSSSGTIVFAPDVIMTGLFRVGVGGIERATLLDPSLGDTSHCWPVFLSDGIHFFYFVRSAQAERRGVYLGRIDRPAAPADMQLLRSDSNPVYIPMPGTPDALLVYVVDGRVEARRFDGVHLRLAGDARAVGLTAAGTTLIQPAMLSASADVLAYASETVPYEGGSRLEAADRNGRRLRLWETAESQNWPRLSPDGRYLARERVDELRNTPNLWVEDLERGANVRVTTAVEPDLSPVWSPDGRYLAYVHGSLPYRSGKRTLTIAAADGTGVVRELACPGEYCEPTDWTAQGLLVNVLKGSASDVWMVPTEPTGIPRPLLAEPFNVRDARMSANGRWVVYVSSESGRADVSVRSVSGSPKRIRISSEGGDHPVWRRDNAELFFVDPQGQLQSVAVRWSREGLPTFGLPVRINVPPIGRGHWGTPYDVSADGNRVYFLRRNDDPLPHEIHVVIGWRELLE